MPMVVTEGICSTGREAGPHTISDMDSVLQPLRSAYHLFEQRDHVSNPAHKALVDHPKQDELRRLLDALNTAPPVSAWGAG